MADTEKATVLPLPSGTGPGSAAWWATQLDWATEIRKGLLPEWRRSADAYRGKLKPSRPDGIRVNIEFEKTEQKRHKLFFRLPKLKLRALPRTIRDSNQPQVGPNGTPIPPRDLKKAIAIFNEALSRLAGTKGANTKALMDEIVFDVLCPSGIGFTKIGYERYQDGEVPVQIGEQPDPAFVQPGAVLGISVPPPMVPIYGRGPNVVSEKYYASRISPANGLIPPEFRLSDYDQADWLGHDFPILPELAKAKGWTVASKLAPSTNVTDDDRIVEMTQKGQRPGQLRCREIFYYASRLDSSVKHPDKIRRLVFVEGQKEPVVHEDFKDQRFDGRGRFVAGLRTLPIKVYTLRYVSDCAYPPSDCAITSGAVDELSEFRTVQMIHRRKASAMRWIDIHGLIDDKVKDAIKRGEYYDLIPTDGPGDKMIGEIAQAQYPPENRISEDRIMGDINRAWALGANQSGVTEQGSATATEIASIAQATQNRLSGEGETTSQYWCRIMEGIGCLVQLYADHEDYVEILGEDGAKVVEAWTKNTVQGEFLYEVVPDSAQAPDAAADRDLALNFHNLVANSPYINGEQDMRDLADAFGRDPDRLVKQPDPPPPEKPKINLAVNGKDLDPQAPQYENVVNVLIAAGIPAAQMEAPQEAPSPDNPVKPAQVIDKERLRMAEADANDGRGGGLVGVGGR